MKRSFPSTARGFLTFGRDVPMGIIYSVCRIGWAVAFVMSTSNGEDVFPSRIIIVFCWAKGWAAGPRVHVHGGILVPAPR